VDVVKTYDGAANAFDGLENPVYSLPAAKPARQITDLKVIVDNYSDWTWRGFGGDDEGLDEVMLVATWYRDDGSGYYTKLASDPQYYHMNAGETVAPGTSKTFDFSEHPLTVPDDAEPGFTHLVEFDLYEITSRDTDGKYFYPSSEIDSTPGDVFQMAYVEIPIIANFPPKIQISDNSDFTGPNLYIYDPENPRNNMLTPIEFEVAEGEPLTLYVKAADSDSPINAIGQPFNFENNDMKDCYGENIVFYSIDDIRPGYQPEPSTDYWVCKWTPGYNHYYPASPIEDSGMYYLRFSATDEIGVTPPEEDTGSGLSYLLSRPVRVKVIDVTRPAALDALHDQIVAEGDMVTMDIIAEDPDWAHPDRNIVDYNAVSDLKIMTTLPGGAIIEPITEIRMDSLGGGQGEVGRAGKAYQLTYESNIGQIGKYYVTAVATINGVKETQSAAITILPATNQHTFIEAENMDIVKDIIR
ncbi:MAG: hypothetical protein Q8R48_05480, partial [Candidatus Omnitrophota bacterium]|nr:hypothetical protein [Candidatus Omnitrophota bacterium]